MKVLLSIFICSVVLVAPEAKSEMDLAVQKALWNAQQELKAGCQSPNEVPISIIQQPNGNLDVVHPAVREADSSHVSFISPQNSVYGGHTHPAESQIFNGTRTGTSLGLSGVDMNTINQTGIPGGAYDCASGIHIGMLPASASESGEVEYFMLDCDDTTETCNMVSIPPGGITDYSLKDPNGNPIPRTVSPDILKKRYNDWLDCINNVCQLGEDVCRQICDDDLEREKLRKEQVRADTETKNKGQEKKKDNDKKNKDKDKKKDKEKKKTAEPQKEKETPEDPATDQKTVSIPTTTTMHHCTKFEFVRDQRAGDVMWHKIYRCTECGKEKMVDVKNGEAIDDVIADNKQAEAFDKKREEILQTTPKATGNVDINFQLPPDMTKKDLEDVLKYLE